MNIIWTIEKNYHKHKQQKSIENKYPSKVMYILQPISFSFTHRYAHIYRHTHTQRERETHIQRERETHINILLRTWWMLSIVGGNETQWIPHPVHVCSGKVILFPNYVQIEVFVLLLAGVDNT